DTPKIFAPRTQPGAFPPLLKQGHWSCVAVRRRSDSRDQRARNSDALSEAYVPPPLPPLHKGGKGKGRSLRPAPASFPVTNRPETQSRCQRIPCPPPLHKGGKGKGRSLRA